MSTPSPAHSGPQQPRTRPWVKLAVVAVVLVAVVALANHFGLFDMLKEGSLKDRVERLDAMFKGMGLWAPLVLIAIWIAASVIMLPALAIPITSGPWCSAQSGGRCTARSAPTSGRSSHS